MKIRLPGYFLPLTKILGVVCLLFVFTLACCKKSPSSVWFPQLPSHPPNEAGLAKQLQPWLPFFFNSQHPVPELGQGKSVPDKLRMVFLSIPDRDGRAQIFYGFGNGWQQALLKAWSRFQEKHPKVPTPPWIKLDLVTEVKAEDYQKNQALKDFDRGLEGIAFAEETQVAFLPREVVSQDLLSDSDRLHTPNMAEYLQVRPEKRKKFLDRWKEGLGNIFRFKTQEFLLTPEKVLPLFRGHREFENLSPEQLLQSAEAGGKYLLRGMKPNGAFTYYYFASRDRAKQSYNILRHAGATFSLLQLYEVTKNPDYLRGAQSALDFLIQQIVPCPNSKNTAQCVNENQFIKLGGNGLTLLALARYTKLTEDPRYLEIMRGIAKGILALQQDNGSFRPHKFHFKNGQPHPFISQYYPGEAIFGLMALYEIDPNAQWLTAAEKNARYLILERDKGKNIPDLPHDHWLLYGLNEIYRYRPDPLYQSQAKKITQAMAREQNLTEEPPDWHGSYHHPPRTTPTATRSEGFTAAYPLAQATQDIPWMELILRALQNGVRFQLMTQVRPETAMYLPQPQWAMGGFHSKLVEFDIRIDFVQHNISSILGLREILSAEQANKKKP